MERVPNFHVFHGFLHRITAKYALCWANYHFRGGLHSKREFDAIVEGGNWEDTRHSTTAMAFGLWSENYHGSSIVINEMNCCLDWCESLIWVREVYSAPACETERKALPVCFSSLFRNAGAWIEIETRFNLFRYQILNPWWPRPNKRDFDRTPKKKGKTYRFIKIGFIHSRMSAGRQELLQASGRDRKAMEIPFVHFFFGFSFLHLLLPELTTLIYVRIETQAVLRFSLFEWENRSKNNRSIGQISNAPMTCGV